MFLIMSTWIFSVILQFFFFERPTKKKIKISNNVVFFIFLKKGDVVSGLLMAQLLERGDS